MDVTTADALRGRRRWRMLAWGGAAGLLALPAVAMLFTDQVRWSVADFVAMGAILATLAGAFDVLIRRGGLAYQAGCALALGATFLLVWMNLAVGIIGAEDDPRNLMFAGVLAVAGGGAIGAGFAAAGMARAMAAAAVAQALIPLVVLTGPAAADGTVQVGAFTLLSGFFVALWLAAAGLFRAAARDAMPGE